MSNWNMPPGVSTRDIPGNGPRDLDREYLEDEISALKAAMAATDARIKILREEKATLRQALRKAEANLRML